MFGVAVPLLTRLHCLNYEYETLTFILQSSLDMARILDSTSGSSILESFMAFVLPDRRFYAMSSWASLSKQALKYDVIVIRWGCLCLASLKYASRSRKADHGRTWCLLARLASCVKEVPGELGRLAESLEKPLYDGGRQRDIYPLPLVSFARVDYILDRPSSVTDGMLEYINAVIVVLIFTYGVRAPVHLPRTGRSGQLSSTQTVLIKRVIASCEQLASRLATCVPQHSSCEDAWMSFERAGHVKSVALLADKVDNINNAGACDPLL